MGSSKLYLKLWGGRPDPHLERGEFEPRERTIGVQWVQIVYGYWIKWKAGGEITHLHWDDEGLLKLDGVWYSDVGVDAEKEE